jgi:TatA/E family protein of Tat protein translocase
MFGSIGGPELIVIFVVALLIFGPRRLSEIGRTLGKALGEFRRAAYDLRNTLDTEVARVESAERRERLQEPPAEGSGAASIAGATPATAGAVSTDPLPPAESNDAGRGPASDNGERRDPASGDEQERRDIG